MHLSHTAAQSLMLAATGLLQPHPEIATKQDLLACIRRMGVLQIDTIHVVARSPYLVLWSRLGAYEPRRLDELLAEGALFEYWAHEACFLPIEDYPLYRRLMLAQESRMWRFVRTWTEENHEHMQQLLNHIRENGPVRSSDFMRTDGQSGTWWNWKPEKMALEMLFTTGELMIARRHNFQRIYDVRERVLPTWNDTDAPPLEQVRRTQALKAVRALGVTHAGWTPDYFRTKKNGAQALLDTLADEGALLRATVEGWDAPAYMHPDNVALAETAASGALQPTLTTLLSPFDPLVWDRQRALAMFGFDYRIECYTPAAKRRYGYFTLPILRRGAIIGRLDPKAHRKDGLFEIKALHLEPGIPVTEELAADIAGALRDCAGWHQTPDVVVRWSDPPEAAPLVQQQLENKST
ncbi:MAG: winged helix-turn-helix domain-containing protein [Blastochloris sp.]|nr:winged helix-turn-helix domain-containing protein [Blastochloris sp.]